MSILAVTAPAARRGLTTVATVTRELGITGSADHDFLEDLILQRRRRSKAGAAGPSPGRTSQKRSISRPNGQCCIWPAGRTSPSYRLSRMARLSRRTSGSSTPHRANCGGSTTPTAASPGRRPRSSSPMPPVMSCPEDLERACLETVKGPLVCPLARSPDQGRAGPRDRLGRLLGAVHRRRRSRPAARRHRALATLLPAHGLRTIAMLNPGISAWATR